MEDSPVRLYNCARWEISFEDFSYRGILDQAQLNTETNHDTQNECHDKHFESPQPSHSTVRFVEEEDKQYIYD
jgi:hypothetical protein